MSRRSRRRRRLQNRELAGGTQAVPEEEQQRGGEHGTDQRAKDDGKDKGLHPEGKKTNPLFLDVLTLFFGSTVSGAVWKLCDVRWGITVAAVSLAIQAAVMIHAHKLTHRFTRRKVWACYAAFVVALSVVTAVLVLTPRSSLTPSALNVTHVTNVVVVITNATKEVTIVRDVIPGTTVTHNELKHDFRLGYVVFHKKNERSYYFVRPEEGRSWHANWEQMVVRADFRKREVTWTLPTTIWTEDFAGNLGFRIRDMHTSATSPLVRNAIYHLNFMPDNTRAPDFLGVTLNDDQAAPVFALGFRYLTEDEKAGKAPWQLKRREEESQMKHEIKTP